MTNEIVSRTIEPAAVLYKKIEAMAQPWLDHVVERRRIRGGYTQEEYILIMRGPDEAPQDVLGFLCDRTNWGGVVESKKQEDGNWVYHLTIYTD